MHVVLNIAIPDILPVDTDLIILIVRLVVQESPTAIVQHASLGECLKDWLAQTAVWRLNEVHVVVQTE